MHNLNNRFYSSDLKSFWHLILRIELLSTHLVSWIIVREVFKSLFLFWLYHWYKLNHEQVCR